MIACNRYITNTGVEMQTMFEISIKRSTLFVYIYQRQSVSTQKLEDAEKAEVPGGHIVADVVWSGIQCAELAMGQGVFYKFSWDITGAQLWANGFWLASADVSFAVCFLAGGGKDHSEHVHCWDTL